MEHRINKIHERAFCLIYPSDLKLTFKELLEKNKTVNIHQKNLQALATEIFKAKLNISPEILQKLFSYNVRKYNLRRESTSKQKKKFCLLWKRKPLFTCTEDMRLSSTQFQKRTFTRKV